MSNRHLTGAQDRHERQLITSGKSVGHSKMIRHKKYFGDKMFAKDHSVKTMFKRSSTKPYKCLNCTDYVLLIWYTKFHVLSPSKSFSGHFLHLFSRQLWIKFGRFANCFSWSGLILIGGSIVCHIASSLWLLCGDGNTGAPAEAPADGPRESSIEPAQAPAAAPTEDQTAAPAQDAPPAEGELLIHSVSHLHLHV